MALAVTANKFNKLPSELVGIEELEIALPFNIECADVLFQSELDREVRMAEMFGLGQLERAFGGGAPPGSGAANEYETW